MNYDESDLEKIRIMEPSHAYNIANYLNDVYAFFTDENLENDPNKTLEILYKFDFTETAKKICEKRNTKASERMKIRKLNFEML
ncbi:MAG: hypothetical protein WA139_02600 [Candidatus Aenigmatarchaeota archaeon]